MTLVWVLLTAPTILWWRESILWIGLISIYANIVGHWSSWEAAKAGETAEAFAKSRAHEKSTAS